MVWMMFVIPFLLCVIRIVRDFLPERQVLNVQSQ